MTWARIDDGYLDHPRVVALPPLAQLLHLRLIIWAAHHLADGQIPPAVVSHVSRDLVRDTGDLDSLLCSLVGVGLLVADRDMSRGWRLRDWHDYCPSREDVERRRLSEAQRKAAWRAARATASVSSSCPAGTPAPQDAGVPSFPSRPVPTRPVKIPPPSEEGGPGGEPPAPAHAALARKGPRKSPDRPLPDDWRPDASCERLAGRLGVDIGREVEQFADHARAHGRRCRDWQAAMRMWLRKAAEFRAREADRRMVGAPRDAAERAGYQAARAPRAGRRGAGPMRLLAPSPTGNGAASPQESDAGGAERERWEVELRDEIARGAR